MRAKRQKFWTAAKLKAAEKLTRNSCTKLLTATIKPLWPTLGLKNIQARMEDIALRESAKKRSADDGKRALQEDVELAASSAPKLKSDASRKERRTERKQ